MNKHHAHCLLPEQAGKYCAKSGLNLTSQQRRVLDIICASARPVGAYDILNILRSGQPKIAPPTIYRALDFLQQQGLIHKLESLHAYLACAHPEHGHLSQFLICTRCGKVKELEDTHIADSVDHAVAASGFQVTQGLVEVSGVCANCVQDEA